MTSTEQDQLDRFTAFVSGSVLNEHKPNILAGHPLIIRPHQINEPWHFTTDRMQAILREHHPDLSATVHGSACVIFHEKNK